MKFRWMWMACLAFMTSCGKEIPSDIIQPLKMEKVLYDYHLSMGVSSNMNNAEKEACKKFVFQKHGISEAEFDSSMVWYTRETKELTAIYNNLDRKFNQEHKQIERLLESREEASNHTSVSGDTVDVWRKNNLYWLTSRDFNKRMEFEIKPDTTFHKKDEFRWEMQYSFFSPGEAIMGMNVIYMNDSVISTLRKVNESGTQSIILKNTPEEEIQSINGFIYVPKDSVNQPNILVHHIALTRYHVLPGDTLNAGKPQIPVQEGVESREEEMPEEMPEEVQPVEESEPEEEHTQSISSKRKPRKALLEKADNRR